MARNTLGKVTTFLIILTCLFLAVAPAHAWLVERVSLTNEGAQGQNSMGSHRSSISNDGRYIAFVSSATNLVADDTNNQDDIFLRDRKSGTTVRVNLDSSGNQLVGHYTIYARLSGNGKVVAFATKAGDVVSGAAAGIGQVYARDLTTNQTTAVSVGPEGVLGNSASDSGPPSLSEDGRYIVFSSTATNLVAGVMDGKKHIYLRDRQSNQTILVSHAADGTPGNGDSDYPFISGNGRYVAFNSKASNLVTGRTGNVQQ